MLIISISHFLNVHCLLMEKFHMITRPVAKTLAQLYHSPAPSIKTNMTPKLIKSPTMLTEKYLKH